VSQAEIAPRHQWWVSPYERPDLNVLLVGISVATYGPSGVGVL
jgi:hypothetical protein